MGMRIQIPIQVQGVSIPISPTIKKISYTLCSTYVYLSSSNDDNDDDDDDDAPASAAVTANALCP
jgi:hypothetical protein